MVGRVGEPIKVDLSYEENSPTTYVAWINFRAGPSTTRNNWWWGPDYMRKAGVQVKNIDITYFGSPLGCGSH